MDERRSGNGVYNLKKKFNCIFYSSSPIHGFYPNMGVILLPPWEVAISGSGWSLFGTLRRALEGIEPQQHMLFVTISDKGNGSQTDSHKKQHIIQKRTLFYSRKL